MHIKRKREELEAEISNLHEEVDQIKKHHDLTIMNVTKEKEVLELKA